MAYQLIAASFEVEAAAAEAGVFAEASAEVEAEIVSIDVANASTFRGHQIPTAASSSEEVSAIAIVVKGVGAGAARFLRMTCAPPRSRSRS